MGWRVCTQRSVGLAINAAGDSGNNSTSPEASTRPVESSGRWSSGAFHMRLDPARAWRTSQRPSTFEGSARATTTQARREISEATGYRNCGRSGRQTRVNPVSDRGHEELSMKSVSGMGADPLSRGDWLSPRRGYRSILAERAVRSCSPTSRASTMTLARAQPHKRTHIGPRQMNRTCGGNTRRAGPADQCRIRPPPEPRRRHCAPNSARGDQSPQAVTYQSETGQQADPRDQRPPVGQHPSDPPLQIVLGSR